MLETLTPLYGCLFVLAGILIGFALWHRDRSGDEEARTDLESENRELQGTIQQQRAALARQEENAEQHRGRLHILEELCEDVVNSRDELQREFREVNLRLVGQQDQLVVTRQQLDDEQQRRVFAEDLLHQTQQQTQEQLANYELQWQEKCQSIQQELSESQSDAQRLIQSQDEAQRKLHLAETRIAELENVFAGQQSLLEKTIAGEAGQEISLETVIRQYQLQVGDLESRCHAALSEKVHLEKSQDALLSRMATLERELADERANANELEMLRAQQAALSETIEQGCNRIEQVTAQRDGAMTELRQLRTEFDAMTSRSANQETTIRWLREQHAHQAEHAFQEINSRLSHLVCQRDQALDELKALQNEIPKWECLQVEVYNRTSQLEKATQQRDETAATLSRLEAKYVEQQNLHESEREQWAADHAEQLSEQLQQATMRIKQVIEQRDRAFDDADRLAREHESAQNEVASLRVRVKASEATIRNLRRERAAVISRRRSGESPLILKAEFGNATADNHDPEYDGPTRLDPVWGQVFVQPPRFRDDLKQISGIAGVLEQRLNDHGIYTYRQIMNWCQDTSEEISRQLSFPGRIRRDDWVGQARRLYHDSRSRAA